jgi:hypothetical protein
VPPRQKVVVEHVEARVRIGFVLVQLARKFAE